MKSTKSEKFFKILCFIRKYFLSLRREIILRGGWMNRERIKGASSCTANLHPPADMGKLLFSALYITDHTLKSLIYAKDKSKGEEQAQRETARQNESEDESAHPV